MKLSELAGIYDRLSKARSEQEKTRILAEAFRGMDQKTLAAAAHLTVGEIVPPELSDKLGIGPGTIRQALTKLTGKSPEEIDEEVRHSGDMSLVAAQLDGRRRDTLEVHELWQLVRNTVEKDGDRIKLLETVYSSTSANGAKYFTRMLLNQMRIGVGYGTIIRAVGLAFDVAPAAVERSYTLTNDIGLVAALARKGIRALERTGITLFRPYQFMNAHKVDEPEEIFRRLKGKKIIFETKYDGARLQIHIKKGKPMELKIYSRRLNDDTTALPDIVAAVRKAWKGGDAIVEGEAVAFDPTLTKKLPFQAVLMRLGRVHGIAEKAQEIPLVLHLFDLLYSDGEDLINLPQATRREKLKKLFRETDRVKMTNALISDRVADEERFFKQAIKAGHEGLMAKDPDAVYVPGRRTYNWMKLKPAFETLDVVVVGGIWGSGRRKGTLSSLVVAVRDKNEFKTVGKVGTGFSEEVLADLTSKLTPLIITSRGRNVEIEPSMVIEVDFQDIQKTSAYSSGFALRIPRFKRVRVDKSVREADSLDRLKKLYKQSH